MPQVGITTSLEAVPQFSVSLLYSLCPHSRILLCLTALNALHMNVMLFTLTPHQYLADGFQILAELMVCIMKSLLINYDPIMVVSSMNVEELHVYHMIQHLISDCFKIFCPHFVSLPKFITYVSRLQYLLSSFSNIIRSGYRGSAQ